ncbi:hypothetical protein PPERSA_03491 [Pseudocohnilembus persalinus]|uniref:Uncharacterized protein n=1 Tax=Pseudocohnilembus persalinus TaxID=266149 RepID=A0A0V0QC08_PSEPJ|nr:hypothetical protein PPERSA_03491 [Pseudocohnilembus persalinus]|eukprot:KRW99690.1 hypothetical protein PPERSA_03491 [Pseudocohnilembus persalinus]
MPENDISHILNMLIIKDLLNKLGPKNSFQVFRNQATQEKNILIIIYKDLEIEIFNQINQPKLSQFQQNLKQKRKEFNSKKKRKIRKYIDESVKIQLEEPTIDNFSLGSFNRLDYQNLQKDFMKQQLREQKENHKKHDQNYNNKNVHSPNQKQIDTNINKNMQFIMEDFKFVQSNFEVKTQKNEKTNEFLKSPDTDANFQSLL